MNLEGPKVIGKVSINETAPEFKIVISSEGINTYEKEVTVVAGAVRLYLNCSSTIDTLMYLIANRCAQMYKYDTASREFEATNIGKSSDRYTMHAGVTYLIGEIATAHANLIGIIQHNNAAKRNDQKPVSEIVCIDIPIFVVGYVLAAIRRSESKGIDLIYQELTKGYIYE